ncbi:hypothetical protein SKAU_G00386240 [Synaphobranchus kaupii]|uniref:Ig-like domain-containing protein n=1 Tax=Synaphobranchus kaupii TaxID=118154 RepID=A0A9Q1EEN2_SYNKA|nr:hypothetical protein SKAU_G00386240 [Synaphobranchus kaupii]
MSVRNTKSYHHFLICSSTTGQALSRIERPISITKELKDCEAKEGEDLVLSCQTSKSCDVQWYKDGILVQNTSKRQTSRSETEATLTIRGVGESDVGTYKCEAGGATTKARVTVKALPAEFVQKLKNQETKEGGSITLCCEFSKPGGKAQWKKGTEVLTSGDRYKMKQSDTTFELKMSNMKPEDSGDYSCECADQKTIASIKVHVVPVTFTKELKNQECEEGGSVTLQCEISKPGATVEWRKGTELLKSGEKCKMKQKDSSVELKICHLTPEDSGDYSSNCGDHKTTASVSVKALPITFTRELKNQECEEGGSVTLQCEISKPGAPVEWRKGTELLKSGEKYKMKQKDSSVELKICHLTPEDSGDYSCNCGDHKTTASVSVKALPITFTRELKNQECEEGGSVTLHCELSKPGAPVEWRKGTELLKSGEKYKMKQKDSSVELKICHLTPEDSGDYSCNCGDHKTTASVSVKALPITFTRELKNQECEEGGSVTLHCELSKPGAPVEWRKGTELLKSGEKYKMKQKDSSVELKICHLTPEDSGDYSCNCGDHKTTASVSVKALPITFTRELKNQECEEGGSVTLQCEISKPGAPVEWRKGTELLKSGEKYKMKQKDSSVELKICHLTPEDSGDYNCNCGDHKTTASVSVKALPITFTRELKNQECEEGGSVTLHCELSKPGASVEWRKGTELLKSGEKYKMKQKDSSVELKICHLTPEDSGDYNCNCGDHKTTASISVKALPITFTRELKNQECEEGGSVTLQCELSKPGAAVEWRKGTELLKSGEKYKMKQKDSSVELKISHLTPEDSGDYNCNCGDHKTTASVSVKALPITFTRELKNQECEEGGSVTLHCELSKPGAPVEWRKGTELLKSGEKYKMKQKDSSVELKICHLTPEDSGDYNCNCGDHKTTASVSVKALPITFTRELKNQECEEGGSVTLHCELSKPGASVDWRKGTELLRSGEKYKMKQKDSSVELKICHLTPEDSGDYNCNCGDHKTTASVSVKALPITFTRELKNQECEEGGSVTLHCELSKPGASVEWRKGTELLKSGEKYKMKQKDSSVELKISHLTPEDSGDYNCNCGDHKTTASISVKALPITFTRELKNQECEEGGSVTLHCELSKPGASVEWRKGTELLKSGEKYKMKQKDSSVELKICHLTPEDSGDYNCNCGDHKTTASVSVKALPITFTRELKNQECEEGGSVTLHCELSKPGASVEWRKGTELLKSGEKYKMKQKDSSVELKICHLTPEDSGDYNCNCGDHKTTASISVKALPITFTRELKNQECEEGGSVTLQCELSKPGAAVEWRKGTELLKSGEKYKMKQKDSSVELKICHLTPEDSGDYNCNCGDHKTTASISVKALPITFTRELKNQECEEGGSVTLHCELSKPGAPVEWRKGTELLKSGEKYKMKQKDSSVELKICHLTPEDSGDYSCNCGDHKTTASVSVKEVPVLQVSTQELKQKDTIEVGDAYATETPVVPVASEQGIESLESKDEGQVDDVPVIPITSKPELEEKDATEGGDANALLVTFTRELKNQECEEGGSVTLQCELSKPGAAVEWRKGTELLKSGEKYKMKQKDSSVELKICHLTPEDCGDYSCITGDKQSSAHVKVNALPLTFIKELQDQECEEGGSVTLWGELSKPAAPVEWRKRGVVLQSGDKCQIRQEGTVVELIVRNLKMEDTGNYICDAGEMTSVASLKVNALPVIFKQELRDQEAAEGGSITLRCELSKPKAPVEWRKGGMDLCPCAKYEMSREGCSAQLVIHSVDAEDSGEYTCAAGGPAKHCPT